jgi:restriction system protein
MPWRHLELLTAEIYERLGYKVTDRGLGSDKAKADGGIDLDLHRDGKHWVVQCKKCTGDSVDVDKIRQLHSAMVAAHADHAIFVTTTSFTEPAEQWAYDNNIELVDNARLWELVQLARAEERVQELATPSTTRRMAAPAADVAAPTGWCGAPMQQKQPREGGKQFTPFWGCSNYGRSGCTFKTEMIVR